MIVAVVVVFNNIAPFGHVEQTFPLALIKMPLKRMTHGTLIFEIQNLNNFKPLHNDYLCDAIVPG